MNYIDMIKQRRSRYNITNASPISNQQIENIVGEAITYTPSAFHSQSSRVILLFGEQHLKLWDIVKETLRGMVPSDKFGPTEAKINSFAAGYGTILYFEDMDVVSQLQQDFKLYAENFPTFSNQSAGMLQFAVWTALANEGLGASLQHYNPIIDEKVAEEWNIPKGWKLLAQMPFGTPIGEDSELEYAPIENRLKVFGN